MAIQAAERTYLFIDGEYLRRVHRDAMHGFVDVDGDLELYPLMRDARADRAFFYDSIDDVPREGETSEECQKRIAPLEQFFGRARALSGVHVRLGTVAGKRRRQKEVDILLATDMLTHGFNGNMEKSVLLAGDLDFRPIVEALVRHGVFVEVWYHRSSIAQDLPGAADFGHALRFRQLHSWNTEHFQTARPLPRDSENVGKPQAEILRVGAISNHRVELYQVEREGAQWHTTTFYFWIDTGRGSSIHVSDEDAALIERYVTVQYGPITWSAEKLSMASVRNV